MVILRNKKKEILITKEYRHGARKVIYGLPGGIIEKKDTPLQTIKRELYEETGIIAKKWKFFHKFLRHCSYNCGVDHVYIADFFDKKSILLNEIEELKWFSIKKVKKMIADNLFINSGVGFSLSKYILAQNKIK